MGKRSIEFYISILSLVVAIAGSIFSIQANVLARKSNEIAEQANSIAFKATNPEITIKANSKVFSFTLHGCHFFATGNYQASVVGTQDLVITNSGGNNTSLIEVNIINSGYKWELSYYGDKERIAKIDLPFDIPAGSSKKIFITAKAVVSRWENLSNAPEINVTNQYADFLNQNVNWQWNFEFGNANIATMQLDPIPSSEPYLEFDLNLCSS